MMRSRVVIGTRRSQLALWQTGYVRNWIVAQYPGLDVETKEIVTEGDKTQDSMAPIPQIGGKGLFTLELEEALTDGSIDLAVHCLKDLPTTTNEAFTLAAIPERENPMDGLVSRSGQPLKDLSHGAIIGTSSVRRASQILALRNDFRIAMIRGNIDTRVDKVFRPDKQYDAAVLAVAGLSRLGRGSEFTEIFQPSVMLPAPGQGALAVQVRSSDDDVIALMQPFHCRTTERTTTAERSLLHALNAGCNTPVAALGRIERVAGDEILVLEARCLAPDGSRVIELRREGFPEEAEMLGRSVAEEALSRGFRELLGL